MQKPETHIFACNSFRVSGDPQGTCNRKHAVDLLQYMEEAILDRGLDAMVSSTGCLKMCEKGPVIAIYPQGWWYGEMTQDKIDQVLDALENNQPVDEFLIT